MSVSRENTQRYRRLRLLVPIAGMTLGTIVLLVLLTAFLIICFDWIASDREQHMVEQGFQRQVEQYQQALEPQADWDRAVLKLDHTFDADFADNNFGTQLYTYNGFTRTFFVDGDGAVVYASVNGKRADKAAFGPFAKTVGALLGPIRAAEARRPPIKPAATDRETVVKPIQANGLVKVSGTVYIVIATLIQPDLGHELPQGPRAPVAITAMPVNDAMLQNLASRYLVDDLEVINAGENLIGKAEFRMRSPWGQEIAALAWTPRRPGIILLNDLRLPMLGALILLGFVGWLLIRRSRVIIDELILSERQAKHLAHHDQLTGLPNRTMLFEHLPGLVGAVGRDQPVLAVLGIDLDRFKEVNDTMGHEAGDCLLTIMAGRLHAVAAAHHGAIVARLGGDEFVLVCPVRDHPAAAALAERCLDELMQSVDCEYGHIDVGCSIGVALIEDSTADPSAILRRADMALYKAKDDGKGQISFYEPGMYEAFQARKTLEDNLRTALRDGGFRMVYQPQVDLSGDVRAVEALLRWPHPTLGHVSPAVFIPLAEETGLILAIGEFVMRRVFEETAHWSNLRVAINVSAIQMRTPGYAAKVMQLAASAGIDPARYEIELTETALLGDGPAIAENFGVLRRAGFSIVLDDFGTGYSSLSLLHRFRVDKIKIDRSFVSELGESEETNALVSAIVKLARSFRLGVIAEGVETEVQLRQLMMAGCGEFQGFLTGIPVPAEEIAPLFESASEARRLA